jgi:hypothetical protein
LWRYQAVYEWRQSFPPGETTIEIVYRPLTSSPAEFGENAFCVDEAQRANIAARKAKGESYEVATLGYILTAAPNWNGAIENFSLAVERGGNDETEAATLAAFCPPDVGPVTHADGGSHWQTTNFTPTRDIAVVFYYFR